MTEWTDKEPNTVARGTLPDGTFVYVKTKEGESAEAALERVKKDHPEVRHWERKHPESANPGPGAAGNPRPETSSAPAMEPAKAAIAPSPSLQVAKPAEVGPQAKSSSETEERLPKPNVKRRSALLVTSDVARKLKRAAMDNPEPHRKITYTDDPAEAAAAGVVVVVAPRRADEVKDVTAIVEEAKDLKSALEAVGAMTDDKIMAYVGDRMYTADSIRDSRKRFLGGK